MGYLISTEDAAIISGFLGSAELPQDRGWLWKLHNETTNQAIILNIYNTVDLPDGTSGNLISVQTQHGYFELHNFTHYLTFEPDEVFFIFATDEKLSCLIVGKECTCSMYSNINREILSSDFTDLDPAVLLSAMQLSITDSILQ